MAHFAHVTQEDNVCSVIVIEQDVLDAHNGWPCPNCGVHATRWVQTSYNTVHGAHTQGGTPLRKNFAGVGFTYDPVRDAFIPPKPYASWVLDEDACDWKAPKESPRDKAYDWSEDLRDWVEYKK
jgi:predicted RNA-binding Zn-ribbon protein involved in translation (DUF1610 family)